MSVAASPALHLHGLIVADDPVIAHVICQVFAEYGLTADKDHTVIDPDLDELYQACSQPGHAYRVAEREGEVVGDGGITPLTESGSDICKLQKMYFLPAIRGKGLTKKPALMAMEQAREMGFRRCYLEMTAFLKEAITFYEHLGLEHIDYALSYTGRVDYKVRMLHEP